jgi:signal peptidase II
MKKIYDKYWQIGAITLLIVVLDQWTKNLVRQNIPLRGTWEPEALAWLAPYARIVHWYNTGAAFGMFKDGSMVFTVLAFIVIGVILYYYPQVDKADWTLRLALSMQLGGAIGNLIDRLRIGHVTDFISVGNFPVFNVADACITMGALILFFDVWRIERAEKKKQQAAEQNPPGEIRSE